MRIRSEFSFFRVHVFSEFFFIPCGLSFGLLARSFLRLKPWIFWNVVQLLANVHSMRHLPIPWPFFPRTLSEPLSLSLFSDYHLLPDRLPSPSVSSSALLPLEPSPIAPGCFPLPPFPAICADKGTLHTGIVLNSLGRLGTFSSSKKGHLIEDLFFSPLLREILRSLLPLGLFPLPFPLPTPPLPV